MWRRSAVLARRSIFNRLISTNQTPFHGHQVQTLAPFASSRHYSHSVSPKSCFHETIRLYSSSDSSDESGSEPIGNGEEPVSRDTVTAVFDQHTVEAVAAEVYLEESEKLQRVLSLLQSSGIDGKSLEVSLDEIGLSLNEEFVVRVLETPYIPGEDLISFFNWAMTKPEFSVTRRTIGSLVTAVCNESVTRNAYALWNLVTKVGENEKGILSTEILNELIVLLSTMAKGKAAFEIFNKYDELGCVPNADTYYFTIEALCRRSIYDWASTVCEKMLSADILPEAEKVGNIISLLCKGDTCRDAHLVYLLAKEKNMDIPVRCLKLLISSLCRKDEDVKLALETLEGFPKEERKNAIKSFSHVIQGLCRAKETEEAKNLLIKMMDAGPPPGNAIFNTVINALSKSGEMEEGWKLLKAMEGRGLKPDVYTYTVIISGYVKGGEMGEARKILDAAKKKHSKLTPVTYHILIRGYCKREQYGKALKLLGGMKEYGVQPNADEYEKLIQTLCLKAVDWTTAEKLLEEMKENGVHPNAITKSLVRAVKECSKEVGNTEVMTSAQ